MADLSINSSLGVKIESVTGTFNAPNSTTDLLQVADLKPVINGITQQINEYTGSIHAPGPVVLSKTFEVSFKLYVRGPGGTAPPTADAWIPGRIFRAAGFSEVIQSASIPPTVPEAIGSGTVNSVTLGTTAAATADLYRGLMVFLSALGAGSAGAAMIQAYSAAKVALLPETEATAITGTYQLPKQLAYQLSSSSVVPTISLSCWFGSRRFDGVGMAVSAFKMVFPTASRTLTELPHLEVTLSGDLYADADDSAPIVTPGLAIPPFRNGDLWAANVQLGGSNLTIDFKAQVAYPPNPNKPSGNDPAQMARTERTVSLTLNQVLKATADFNAIADAQSFQSVFAHYGTLSGNMFGIIVPQCRFNYRTPQAQGDFIETTGDAFIDGADRAINFVIPFF
jgi:hypothetical protein